MSWLNTTSITNLAKTAFKEAQRTIDKALDIKEHDSSPTNNEDDEIKERISSTVENVVVNEPNAVLCEPGSNPESTNTNSDNFTSVQNQDVCEIEELCISYPSVSSSAGSISESASITDQTKEAMPNQIRCAAAYQGEDLPRTEESFDSSVSTSSCITIVSEDQVVKENQTIPQLDEGTEDKLMEASSLLSEMMKDALKTETSASVSGDEVETATSSDIEIIASPQAGFRKNLDEIDSMTSSQKTHCRESSAASSDDSIISALEMDKMSRKISELNQSIEAREDKIFELNRSCAEMMEETEHLRSRLSKGENDRLVSLKTTRLQSEEFSQRLSAMEKRYQQAVAEKESLEKRMESMKLNQKLSEKAVENEEIIQELRQEGEKLSKQYLVQSNIIKKLRLKEKEDEQLIKQNRGKNEEFSREVERLKKTLSAKEELERNQIEAVRQLTSSNDLIEKEMIANKVLLRDAQQNKDSLQSSLTALEEELRVMKSDALARNTEEVERSLSQEVSLRQKMQLEFECCSRLFSEEKLALTLRCDELVHTLETADSDRFREKEQSKTEMSRLMQRLQAAEAQCDELSQAMTTATRPLLRQIENLHQLLSSQRLTEEKSEKIFQDKLKDLQYKLTKSHEKEAETRELYFSQQTRISELIEHLNSVTQEKKQLLAELTHEKSHAKNIEEIRVKELTCVELSKKELEQEIELLRERNAFLERQMEIQSNSFKEEKKTVTLLKDRLLERDVHTDDSSVSHGSSPTPSLGKISLSGSLTDSHSSNPWISTDEVFDGGLATPVPKSSLYDTLRAGSYAAVFESLQSQLKTRDGEVFQLQQELHQQEKNRDSLTQELTKMIQSNEECNRRLSALEQLQTQFNELQINYNAILQMYGEKIEENDELRLDLIDVKEMYKAQIDQLLKT